MLRRILAREAAPVALVALVLALALIVTTALRLTALVSFDEAVYKLAANEFANGGIRAVFEGDISRGAARLYSLLLMPLFEVFDATGAVRLGRSLNVLLWFGAALPFFAVARRCMPGWHATIAALLAVCVPWLTISTVLLSEGLSWLLFALALWTMVVALERQSVRWDVLVLVVLGLLALTRLQFLGLVLAWAVAVLVLEEVRDLPRRRPALTLAALAGLVCAVGMLFDRDLLDALTGPYITSRGFPNGLPTVLAYQLSALALGTGVVAVVLGGWWAGGALRMRHGVEAHQYAVVALALGIGVWVLAIVGQGGWVGGTVAEERYYVYVAPLVVIAALAGVAARPPLRALAAGGVLVAIVVAVAPATPGLSAERSFLSPISGAWTDIANRTGIDRRLLGVLVVLVATGAALALLRRGAELLPAVALQLALALYALLALHGALSGIPGATEHRDFDRVAWLDRADLGPVGLLEDRVDPERGTAVDLAFWNDALQRTVWFPSTGQPRVPFPVDAIGGTAADVGPDLRVTPEPPPGPLVTADDSPVVQLSGRTVRRQGDERLVEPARPVQARWIARGLGPDGTIPGVVAVGAKRARIALTVDAPAGPGEVRVQVGDTRRRIATAPGPPKTVTVDACDGAEAQAGTITPLGAPTVRLRAVRLQPC